MIRQTLLIIPIKIRIIIINQSIVTFKLKIAEFGLDFIIVEIRSRKDCNYISLKIIQ